MCRFACLAMFVVACGSNGLDPGPGPGSGPGSGPVDFAIADFAFVAPHDFAVTPDLAGGTTPTSGVLCGAETCTNGSVCCVDEADPTEEDCASSCPSMAYTFACDGVEDCTGFCCGDVQVNFDDSVSLIGTQCASTCQAQFDGSQATAEVCHDTNDCVGYLAENGLPYDHCCTFPAAEGLYFCGPAIAESLLGVSCL